MKIQLCDECRFDGGQHFDEDGNASRPHHEAARAQQRAQAAVEAAHEQQTAHARRIIRWAAETKREFSSNNIAVELAAAQIDGPVVGAAFTYAAMTPTRDDGTGRPWIVNTGTTEQHHNPAVRHRVYLWRSLIWTGRSIPAPDFTPAYQLGETA